MSDIKRGGAQLAEAVKKAYEQGLDDYHLEPMLLVEDGKPVGKIADGDAAVFCCRRGEREIELTEMFTEEGFDKAERRKVNDLDFVIMTMYHDKFKDLPIAFAPSHVVKPLAQVLSEAGRSQFHCAESEKFAHVTFFFNGGENNPFPGEDDLCIPSPKGIDFDQKPELSLPTVAEKVMDALGKYDFVVTNFANGDVIGHTSNSEAKLAAAATVSEYVDRVAHYARDHGYLVAVTADHGNIETLRDAKGKPHVAHTTNLVPFVVLDPQGRKVELRQGGRLGDVAPTVLSVLGIAQPREMTGESLIVNEGVTSQKMMLIILDGWGYGSADDNDAIFLADTHAWDAMLEKYPNTRLKACSEDVGLQAGKAGNSEAGHSNLGAGRVVAQDDVRMDAAIRDGSFRSNPVFLETIANAKKPGADLHLLAYLTEKSSHGCIQYPLMLAEMAEGVENIYFHIIFDGRSTEPGSAPALLRDLEARLTELGRGQIVDGVGRGIALDRDGNYAKIQKAYDCLVSGKGDQYR